jgi:hypothetical protein
MEPMKPMKPMEPMKPMAPMDFGPSWWPEDLGQPSTSGAQNGARYDTGERQISGVSQGGGHGGTLTFSGRDGEVSLDDLPRLD